MRFNTEEFAGSRVLWARVHHSADIAKLVAEALDTFSDQLPAQPNASLLLKPNCNNDLHSLTGNSTDLRVIAQVVRALQERGFTKLTVGDGANVGVDRLGIDFFARLGISGLAEAIGFDLCDLNQSPTEVVQVGKRRVRVARTALEAGLVVNLPKLKTHQEAGLSLAVKNMMGCVAGLDKKIIHEELIPNLVDLALAIGPRLQILDGLICMEGNGPGDGTPRFTGLMAASDDPFVLDAVVGQLTGFDPAQLPLTAEAVRRGILRPADIRAIRTAIAPQCRLDPAPPRTLLSTVIGHNRLAWARDLTRRALYRKPVLDFCYRMKIIQDIYEAGEPEPLALRLNRSDCTDCARCLEVCPLELPLLSEDFRFDAEHGCIDCASCALVCPSEAIRIRGRLGFREAHLRRYGSALRNLEIPVEPSVADCTRSASQKGRSSTAASPRVTVEGIAIDPIRAEELHGRIDELRRSDQRQLVTYVNVHTMNVARNDGRLREAYRRSSLTYCDGAGVMHGARLLGQHLPERMTSASFIHDLCDRWQRDDTSIYFVGGEPGAATAACENLQRRYPDLRLVGHDHGFFARNTQQETDILDRIERARPDILFVGFGTPLQEHWALDNWDRLDARVVWPIGALVDYLSGREPRCPEWMEQHSLEWLFRLAIEPRHKFSRYVIGNPRFMLRMVRDRGRRP